MVKNTPLAAALIIILALVGCGTPPATTGQQGITQPGVVTPTFIPTLGIGEYDARIATTDALGAQARATRDYIVAQETQVAALATAQAQAISAAATGTIQAIATGTAQAMAYSATSTAQVLEVTQQALEIRQTESALVATGTAQAILNGQSAAAATQSAILSAQQIEAAAEQQRIDNLIRQAQADREINKARLSQWTPYFIILAAATIIGSVALFMWYRDHSAVRVVNNIAVFRQPDGTYGTPLLVGNHQPQLALPAPKGEEAIVEGEIQKETPTRPQVGNGIIKPASWDAFSRWHDPRLIPIGCHAVSRKPILVNRETKPHLMIAGSTGGGKSKFTETYIAGNLAAGLHVLIVNPRGSDYKAFKGHPNVTIMPRIDRKERTAMLGVVLDGLVNEMDRRDRILERSGVSNWYQLPTHLGEPGEFLVVIDEFLSLVDDVQLRDKSAGEQMWLALLNLIGEARKFGIYVTVTVTDPTSEALGKLGMRVRRQMGRVVLPMDMAQASRTFIDGEKDEGWPRGSAGLPMGQFLARIRSTLDHGVSFFPSTEQMTQYLNQHMPSNVAPLPDVIQQLTSGRAPLVAEAWSDEAEVINQLLLRDTRQEGTDWLTHEKAGEILRYAPQATSLRRIEAVVFQYNGGQATVTVKGVLIARAVQLYANGTSPYEIERTLFGGPKPFSPDIIQEAITQYQQLPLAR